MLNTLASRRRKGAHAILRWSFASSQFGTQNPSAFSFIWGKYYCLWSISLGYLVALSGANVTTKANVGMWRIVTISNICSCTSAQVLPQKRMQVMAYGERTV